MALCKYPSVLAPHYFHDYAFFLIILTIFHYFCYIPVRKIVLHKITKLSYTYPICYIKDHTWTCTASAVASCAYCRVSVLANAEKNSYVTKKLNIILLPALSFNINHTLQNMLQT